MDTATAVPALKVAADVAPTCHPLRRFRPDLRTAGTAAEGIYNNSTRTAQKTLDDYTVRFAGWTLLEQAVLNTYRRRAA